MLGRLAVSAGALAAGTQKVPRAAWASAVDTGPAHQTSVQVGSITLVQLDTPFGPTYFNPALIMMIFTSSESDQKSVVLLTGRGSLGAQGTPDQVISAIQAQLL